jgi:hypothetical protein
VADPKVWVASLHRSLEADPATAVWLLEHMLQRESMWLRQVLFHCPQAVVQTAARDLIVHAMARVGGNYFAMVPAGPSAEGDTLEAGHVGDMDCSVLEDDQCALQEAGSVRSMGVLVPQNLACRIVHAAVEAVHRFPQYRHAMEACGELLLAFASLGTQETLLLSASSYLSALLQSLLGRMLPATWHVEHLRESPPPLSVLYVLLRCLQTAHLELLTEEGETDEGCPKLAGRDHKCMSDNFVDLVLARAPALRLPLACFSVPLLYYYMETAKSLEVEVEVCCHIGLTLARGGESMALDGMCVRSGCSRRFPVQPGL